MEREMKPKVKVTRDELKMNERTVVKQIMVIEEGGNVKSIDSYIYIDRKEVANYCMTSKTQPTLAFNKDRKLNKSDTEMIISIIKALYMKNNFKITEYFNV